LETFSDFGLESEPDIYLKIYVWRDNYFHQIDKVTPKIVNKIETDDKNIIYEFGVVAI